MQYLTTLTIVKNEKLEYLEEWKSYHSSLGVEHFYILNHIPNDIALPPSFDCPDVTIWNCGPARRQAFFYYEALRRINSVWCMVTDVDEFVVGPQDLPKFLVAYEKYDALAINWLVFGSSGHETSVSPILSNYNWRTRLDYKWNGGLTNCHVKSIVKPHMVRQPAGDPHYFGVNTVNEKFQPVKCALSDYSADLIRLNHYFTRSREDWQNKMDRGRADCEHRRDWSEFDDINRNCFYDENPLQITKDQNDN